MGMRIRVGVIAFAVLLLAEASAVGAGQDAAPAAKDGMDLRAEWKRRFTQLAGEIKARGSAQAQRAAGQAHDPSATILAGA
jgi:hypothetical protein